jgi:signal peptidase I
VNDASTIPSVNDSGGTDPDSVDRPDGEPPVSSEFSPGWEPERSEAKPSHTRNALEWVVVIFGAVLVALLIRNFAIQSYRIPSESMTPTLAVGDRVLVNRLSYDLHEIHRGDVIVFARPESSPAAPGEPDDLIKRVVGLSGETIEARDGTVYVDDKELEEPYLEEGVETFNLDDPVTVPEGEVFVMGDNRGNSEDSRFIGPIPESSVVGRAFAIIWPLNRLSGL